MSDKKSVWKKRLGITVGVLFALYVIVGFMVLPLLVRYVGLKKANEALAGKVSVAAIRVNPFAYSLTLRDITVATPQGETVFAAKRFYGNFAFWSLFGRGWRFQQVLLEEPLVSLGLNAQGELNVQQLLKETPAEAEPTQSGAFVLPLIRVDHVQVRDGRFDLSLVLPGGEFHRAGKGLSFELNDFSTNPQNENPYAFIAHTEHGESLTISGTLKLNPLSASGNVTADEVLLPDYDAFTGGTVGFEVAGGSLSLGFDYRFSPVSEPRGLFVDNGYIRLRDFALQAEGEPSPFQRVGLFEAEGFGVDLLEARVRLGSIRLSDAYLRVVRDKEGLLNLVRYLFPQSRQEEIINQVRADLALAEQQFSQEREIRLGVVSDNQDIGIALTSAWNQVQRLVAFSWQISVGEIRLENNTLDLRDEFTPEPVEFTISKIALSASDLRNYGTEPFPFSASTAMSGGGTFSAEGSFTPEPDSAELRYTLSKFDFTPFQPYLSLFSPARLTSLYLSSDGEGKVSFPADTLPQATLNFNARLDELRLDEPEAKTAAADSTVTGSTAAQPVLTVAAITLDNARAASVPLSFHADLLRISTPVLRVVRDAQGQINLLQLVPMLTQGATPEGAAGAGTESAPATAPTSAPASVPELSLENVSLRELLVENGSLILVDEGVNPPASFAVENAMFRLAPIELKPDSISRFEGRVSLGQGARGEVSLSGELIPLRPLAATQLDVTTAGVSLGVFGGYSDQMVGRPLEQGTLDADLSYKISDSRLLGDNRVQMNQVSFGNRMPDSTGPRLPIDLGMAILVDRNGLMKLDVPVSGDLNDPSFSLGGVIQYAIINVFEKLVTAPFAVLGSLFGGDGEAPATAITFEPGRTDVPVSALASLGLLADALYERPTLALALVPVDTNPEDMVILRERLLQARLEAYGKEQGLSVERTINRLYEQLLTALPSMDPQSRASIEALIARVSQHSATVATGDADGASAPVADAGGSGAFAIPPPVVEGVSGGSLQTVTTRSITRTRRGRGYLTATQTAQVLAPPAPEAAGQTPGAAEQAEPATAQALGASDAVATADAVTRELTVADKRVILLSQTLVSRSAVDELINARMAAISTVLTSEGDNPLAPERIRNAAPWVPQADSDRQASPSVYFDLVPAANTAESGAAITEGL